VSEGREGEAGPTVAGAGWYLEFVEGGALQRVWIHTLPFRIGRRHGLDLVLPGESVSKTHAEIYACGSRLMLRDLDSRNGTFLNREPVEDAPLSDGDVLHFADFEFRLGRSDRPGASPPPPARERPTTAAHPGPRPHRFEPHTRELRELLDEREVTMVFQPIVMLSRGSVVAYEALGRGRHPRLPESPLDLLRIAEDISAEARLSRLFRKRAVELASQRPDLFSLEGRKEAPTVFLNTHPIELDRPGLLESLEELREIAPSLDLALEIHEKVFTRESESYDSFLSRIKEVRQLLLERNVALAYDDFGAGRARLLELAEAPPHYLKFDQRWVEDLDQAPAGKRRLLRSLLALADEFRIKTVAEGIETEAEKRACTEIGFTYGQGFHIGRPLTIDQL
jgi:EAL domain-containing protein (putative c-di-GMP-specific phosphodiesterase class I)